MVCGSFFVCVFKHSSASFLTGSFIFFHSYILRDKIVHTDCLSLYNTLSLLGVSYYTVNHSKNYVGLGGPHKNWIGGIFECHKKICYYMQVGVECKILQAFFKTFFSLFFGGCDSSVAFLKLRFML